MKQRRVIVVGDIMLDKYIKCEVARIDQTAPVPICKQMGLHDYVGGAANVAVNITALGVPTILIGAVGATDRHGAELLAVFHREYSDDIAMFDYYLTKVQNYRTTTKVRLVDCRGQLIARLDDEAVLPAAAATMLTKKFLAAVKRFTPAMIVLADYAKGVLSYAVVNVIKQYSQQYDVPVLIDPTTQRAYSHVDAMLITPNLEEATQLVGDAQTVQEMAVRIYARCHVDNVLITCGANGAYLYAPSQHKATWLSAEEVPVVDTTGAGDTLIAGVAAKLFDDLEDMRTAAAYGIAAATAAVRQHGTAIVYRHEAHKLFVKKSTDKIVDLQQLKLLAASANRVMLPVVTNGVFDILHRGHYKLLDWAASNGNFLIVLVNSDASTRRLKGANRPVQSQELRADMVACHPKVDAVYIFDEDTPGDILQQLGACHLVKGPDYAPATVIDRDAVLNAGGQVSVMPQGSSTDVYSTSTMIEQVKRSAQDH